MTNFPIFFLNKFGISDKTKNRVKNVSETTPGLVGLLATFELPFGYQVEQFVHRIYRLQNVHFWTGSGRTEWFVVFSPIVGSLVWFINFRFNIGLPIKTTVWAFFTPFFWWDGLFWLLLFRFFWMVVAVVLFFLAIYLLAHTK